MSFLPGWFPGAAGAGGGGGTPFTTEWKSAGSGINDNELGAWPWINPSNITASDDNNATIIWGSQTAVVSQILRATNFGFTTDDIPVGATILGIEVRFERTAASGATTDLIVQLRTSSGRRGDNKASGSSWPSWFGVGEHFATYGSEEDDWNAGLSDSDIRGSDFGVDFQAQATDTYVETIRVDHIEIRVHGVA